ncbi:MAG: PQQ-binding-like beta-propeller repeat protein [Planctomycetes bacterium]|nr:PQQ-binding-like beta-propeller repeat protein [Planctomycetota bacterium]MBL7143972.1 PQQ-binding-like beta-propeller repeat protein [Phycisphaerae bacterium]
MLTEKKLSKLSIPTLIFSLIVISAVYADDQPQWGQRYSRNMVSDETHLPESFDPATGKNIKWIADLGTETYSTPVVSGGRVLIGTNNNIPRDPRHKGDRGVLLCLDEKDGSLCWQLVVPKLIPDLYRDWPKSGICSPATVEGDKVYIVSNRGEVMCLDLNGLANGNDGPYRDEARHMTPQKAEPIELSKTDADIIWLFDIRNSVGVHQHDSAHSSILLHGQYLYVNTSNGINDQHKFIPAPDAPSLIVLDKRTGCLVAQDNEQIGPRIFHCTWSSPALGKINGRPLVFFCGGDGICYTYDALSSASDTQNVQKIKNIWKYDCDPDSPKENVHQYMRNRNKSPSNIKSMPVFHEGRLYITHGGDIWWGKEQCWLKCVDAKNSRELWSYELSKGHCCSTPSVHNGLIFVADCEGYIHCVDAKTGKPYWTHDTGNEIWASTLAADGKVYIGTRRGNFWVFAADRNKKIVSSIKLDSPIHGSPVAANGVLYIATMKKLYAVKQSSE